MPRNSHSPTYTPYADAALIASKGINITFDDPPSAIRFQKGFASWVARQMGYEGLSTHRTEATIRIFNPHGVHSSAVVTDAETGRPLDIGLGPDPSPDQSLHDWTLSDLSGPSIRAVNRDSPPNDRSEESAPSTPPQIPDEGLDLE